MDEPAAEEPTRAAPEVEDSCPAMPAPICEAYERVAADCLSRVPRKTRAELREDRARLCKALRGASATPRAQQAACLHAIEDLAAEPSCALQAMTEALSLRPAARQRCGSPSPPNLTPDPAGPVQIAVESELRSPPIRVLAVAVDGVPVITRGVRPSQKALGRGTLGAFRGRLDPGVHRLELLVRQGPDSLLPGSTSLLSRCVTILPGVPLTATAVIAEPGEAMGPFTPFVPRFEVR